MKSSTASISIAALVLSSIVIGALGMHLIDSRWHGFQTSAADGRRSHHFLRVLEEELKLTSDQSQKIRAILEEAHRESEVIRREFGPRLHEQMERTRGRIEALLTPEQKERFERMRRDRRRGADRSLLGEGASGAATPGPGSGSPGVSGSGPAVPGEPIPSSSPASQPSGSDR